MRRMLNSVKAADRNYKVRTGKSYENRKQGKALYIFRWDLSHLIYFTYTILRNKYYLLPALYFS